VPISFSAVSSPGLFISLNSNLWCLRSNLYAMNRNTGNGRQAKTAKRDRTKDDGARTGTIRSNQSHGRITIFS
jgi:hypothetical protein